MTQCNVFTWGQIKVNPFQHFSSILQLFIKTSYLTIVKSDEIIKILQNCHFEELMTNKINLLTEK